MTKTEKLIERIRDNANRIMQIAGLSGDVESHDLAFDIIHACEDLIDEDLPSVPETNRLA
ncbi:MAG: hypothetical protein HC924_17795 [Synechococcaceae cyanobacterium SM2_3_2]|nr:hypothetical protein [Synechococcaceae cyanobacterium SM2_3_2]